MRRVKISRIINTLEAVGSTLIVMLALCILNLSFFAVNSVAGDNISCKPMDRSVQNRPKCSMDITCLDETVLLGNQLGVCIRADCPGIVAILHQRSDEASFRRRFISYRHFAFEGDFVLKDRGTIESGPVRTRELFLVLPGDVIELRTEGEDCLAKIDVRNLGYVKKGNLCELQNWLAEKTFMEMPYLTQSGTPGGAIVSQEDGLKVQKLSTAFGCDETKILHGLVGVLRQLSIVPH